MQEELNMTEVQEELEHASEQVSIIFVLQKLDYVD